MNNMNHPYHIVTPSPWPLIQSLNVMMLLTSLIKWFSTSNLLLFFFSLITNIMSMMQWWRDVNREATFQGFHTTKVHKLLKFGMILFIISELFFFISFFWSYFHMSLSPSIEIGSSWPPSNIMMFNPYSIPLLNTVILISSGMTITWSHYSMLNSNIKESLISLLMTIMLGIYFTTLQMIEYYEAPFTISDSSYGSIFFMATGFHGIHVLIGTTFLIICYLKMYNLQYSSMHHFSFEAASWYWHFVDIIWLFLYMNIYWWNY